MLFGTNESRDSLPSVSTICHFESPLNMLCDTPSNYEREAECSNFITRIPTVWDETRVLDGKLGEYIITARRKGNIWYVGGITNWQERDVELDFLSWVNRYSVEHYLKMELTHIVWGVIIAVKQLMWIERQT